MFYCFYKIIHIKHARIRQQQMSMFIYYINIVSRQSDRALYEDYFINSLYTLIVQLYWANHELCCSAHPVCFLQVAKKIASLPFIPGHECVGQVSQQILETLKIYLPGS